MLSRPTISWDDAAQRVVQALWDRAGAAWPRLARRVADAARLQAPDDDSAVLELFGATLSGEFGLVSVQFGPRGSALIAATMVAIHRQHGLHVAQQVESVARLYSRPPRPPTPWASSHRMRLHSHSFVAFGVKMLRNLNPPAGTLKTVFYRA